MSNGDKKSNKELHREAYGAAMTALRNAHPDEFNALRQAEAKNRGLEWKPKPSEREKAAAQLAHILSEYPDLAPHLSEELPTGASADSAGSGMTEVVD